MSVYPSYHDAHDPKYGDPLKVKIIKANSETLKGYGTIVTDFDKEEVEITPWPVTGWRKLCPETGTMAAAVRNDFVYKWEGDTCKAQNDVFGQFVTGRLPKGVTFTKRSSVLVRVASYFPDGGQVLYPRDRDPFVLLLALPGDDVKPEDFVAFYFDGSFGVQIHANTWRHQVFPIKDQALFQCKQGAVHACICVNTVKEWNKYLEVPLIINS